MLNPDILEETPISLAELKTEIKKIQKRDKDLGFRSGKTMDYLNLFSHIDEKKTKELTEKLDKIASEGLEWKSMIKDFYIPFHKEVEDTLETSERVKAKRELGKDPKSGHTVLVQLSKFGLCYLVIGKQFHPP